jgi:hypothetical protein
MPTDTAATHTAATATAATDTAPTAGDPGPVDRRPRRRRGIRLLLGIAVLAAVGSSLASPTKAASTFSRDLYVPDLYVRQVDDRTCTAAAVAMMVQLLDRGRVSIPVKSNGTYHRAAHQYWWVESWRGQMAILRYEQPRDALNDGVQRGSDPLGWALAVTEMSRYTSRPTIYRDLAFTQYGFAIRHAAKRLAETSKPIGIVVMAGRHAVVMTGFTATADPRTATTWSLLTVTYSDPISWIHRTVSYSAFALSPLFTRYRELDATPSYDARWYGRYVIVSP